MVSGRAPLTPADDEEMRAAVADAIKVRPLADVVQAIRRSGRAVRAGAAHRGGLRRPAGATQRDGGDAGRPGGRAGRADGRADRDDRHARADPGAAQSADSPALRPFLSARGPRRQSQWRRASTIDPPPLAGVRILEITNLIAGPTAGRILADLGADVIKLEPPAATSRGRSGARISTRSTSTSARSASTPRRRAAARSCRRSRPRATRCWPTCAPRRPRGWGSAGQINPRLIETHLTGYGFTGPYSKRPGIDPLAQAYMGMSRAQGGPDNPPVFPAQLAPTDYTNGAMGAFGTILALYVQGAHRASCRTSTATCCRAASCCRRRGSPSIAAGRCGSSPTRRRWASGRSTGSIKLRRRLDLCRRRHRGRAAGACAALTGVLVANRRVDEQRAASERHVIRPQELAGVMGARQVADDARLSSRPRACRAAKPARPGHAEIFLGDPHVVANDMVAVRQHPTSGHVRVHWRSVRFTDTASTAGLATPLLGEHTAEVMAEAGDKPHEIEAQLTSGVVRVERGTASAG